MIVLNFSLKNLSLINKFFHLLSVQVSSVAQSCPTVCDPMNQSTPGLPVHHQLPEFTEIHVYSWVHWNSCLLSQLCHPTISSSVVPFFSCPQSFPASGSFQMSQLFASGGQSIGVSASTSVFPMNTQDWVSFKSYILNLEDI